MPRKKNRKWNVFFDDMVTSCHNAVGYTYEIKFEDFMEDQKTYHAVCWNINQLSFAGKQLPSDVKKILPEDYLAEIHKVSQDLINKYYADNHSRVWTLVQTKAPELLARLEKFKSERGDLFMA